MPSITGAGIKFESRMDSRLYVVLEYSLYNEDPVRYALSSLEIYCDDRLLMKRGLTSDESQTGTEPLYVDSPAKGATLTFKLNLRGYDRSQLPISYTVWDTRTFTYTVQTSPPPPKTEAIVTLYTEPALSSLETQQVSAQLNSYTLTVGKGVLVPIGSTFTLTVTGLPAGYSCIGAYGTGGISISGWTVTVSGDGNIVLQLTSAGAAPPPIAPIEAPAPPPEEAAPIEAAPAAPPEAAPSILPLLILGGLLILAAKGRRSA
jgi:hypothetical protein